MKHAYRINSVNAGVALATGVLLLCIAFGGIMATRYVLAALFLLSGVAFLVVGALNASALHLSENAVTRTLLGRKLKEIPRDELREVGVVGIRVFGNKSRTGTKYIYFSDHKMNEKERFQMCVSWPPKDALYMVWSRKRYDAVQTYWDDDMAEYNTGDEP